MADNIIDNVKVYYGQDLKTNQDFKTNACIEQGQASGEVDEALELCHEEVKARYYGCGLVFPSAVKGTKVLDFGSGAGRDCYILSKLVGKYGFVTGVDMTKEMVDIATKYIPYHMEKFGYSEPNVDFKLGYIEKLQEAGFKDDTYDLIVSNCVINLTADKLAVFKEAFRVLKKGGEFYISDMYADKLVAENLKDDKELWGEGFAGAMYWKYFVDLAKETGFLGPFLVNSQSIVCRDQKLAKLIGDVKYVAATYRLFKPKKGEKESAQSVKYKGTVSECAEKLTFDAKHIFDFNFQGVSAELTTALKQSRYSPYFEFQERSGCCMKGSEYDDIDPFVLASVTSAPACCKKKK